MEEINMKYLLSKSKSIVFVTICIGILVTLCLSDLIESYKMASIPSNGLTNDYYSFSVGEYRDKIVENKIDLSSMLNFLRDKNLDFLLLKESDSEIFGVYSLGDKFKPNIISGRNFSESDFENRTNTMIISKELEKGCISENNKKYYQYDANYFEVIGIFEPSNNSINKDAKAYYNLNSNKMESLNQMYDNYIFGNFNIDAGNKTLEIVNQLDDYCTINILRRSTDNGFQERIQKTLSSQGLALFPILLIIFLLIINSVSISSSWLENRKIEILVRRLVGGTNKKITAMLIRDYLAISTFSYLIVLVICTFIYKFNFISFIKMKFSLETTILSYIVVIFIGLLSSILMLITYYKNDVAHIRR